MLVSFGVELQKFQCITTNISDNNKQYLLHFNAVVVIRNCAPFLADIAYCTEMYLWSVWEKVTSVLR